MARKTVAQVIAELSQFPADMEVMSSTHYDNDTALSDDLDIGVHDVSHHEAHFWYSADPQYANKKVVVIYG